MRPRTLRRYPLFVVALLLPVADLAAWDTIAPGIEYESFTISGPNNLFVTRMDRSNADCIIESSIGQGTWQNGRETVSGMANRYEDTLNYWGQSWGTRSHVVAAINGDYFDYGTGLPTSGQIIGGWYARRFTDWTGGTGFAWQLDRDVFIGGCIRHVASKQKVAYPATGQSQNITNINTARGTDELIAYTPQYGLTTGVTPTGVEAVVEMTRPTLILPTPSYASGTVRAVRQNMPGAPVPFDHIVLSGHGSAATKLLNNVSVGSEVRISQEITHYQHDCSTSNSWDWTKTYASIGGHFHCVNDGTVPSEDWADNEGAIVRHPRTAVAFNETYVYFVVVDGRSGESIGMTITELGNFCLNTLAADHAIAQDGGGSSTLWADGEVKNVPSDGSERMVANGLMMAVVQPKEQSLRFDAGDHLRTLVATPARLGPGSNYASLATVAAGNVGVVVEHSLKGVLATGEHWWKCEIAGTTGWLRDDNLGKGAVPGDLDADGDLDLADFAIFADCMNGPEITTPPVGCSDTDFADADLDDDDDVDLADFDAFAISFGGS